MNINTFRPATAVATEMRPSVVANLIGAWRKYATEAIGTFFLVFTVGASIRSGSALAPLGIGAVLMTMVYAGGHISGAHYNPAVTLAVLVRGRIGRSDAIRYWVAQVGAGALAAAVVRAVVSPGQVRPLAWSGQAIVAAFLAELLVTFALCYVVLNVATSKDGDPIPFDPDGVFPITPNQLLADLDAHSEAGQQARTFAGLFTQMLTALQKSFAGQPTEFPSAEELMFDLLDAGKKLCAIEVVVDGQPTGRNAGPTWEFLPANG